MKQYLGKDKKRDWAGWGVLDTVDKHRHTHSTQSVTLNDTRDCVSRVCGGGGGCAGGGVPLGAGLCCPDVGRCLSGVNINIIITS